MESSRTGEPEVSNEHEHRRRELEELMTVIAAEVARDGGTARLGAVDYRTGAVEVVLSGACGSCTLTGATLEAGIERILRQRLSWVTEFQGTVEESTGTHGTGNWRPRS